jgi:hypothetical protein
VTPIAAASPQRDTSLRTAALLAGLGLLAMTIIAGATNFGVVGNLAVPGDPSATAANLVEAGNLVRLAAAGFVVVAILDVVVAWALYVVLRSVNPSLSMLSAWLRLVYAAVLAVAINILLGAMRLAATEPSMAGLSLESFNSLWQIGLIVFGVHLAIVGLLAWQSSFIPWLFGLLLIISGLGYMIDGFGTLLSPAYSLNVAMFTFMGEVVFMFWLLIRGRQLSDPAGAPADI